jgi:hypothetical protein
MHLQRNIVLVPRYRTDVYRRRQSRGACRAIHPQFSCTRGIDSSSSAAENDADISFCYISAKHDVVAYGSNFHSVKHSVLDGVSSVILGFNQYRIFLPFFLSLTTHRSC